MDSKTILFSIFLIMAVVIHSASASPSRIASPDIKVCNVVHVQAQSSFSGVSVKKQGVGWVYQYPGSKELKIVVPFHVIDLGVPQNNVTLNVTCDNRKLNVEKGMFSAGMDLATFKIANPPSNVKPLIKIDLVSQSPGLQIKWTNVATASGFFAGENGLLPMDLGPSWQIIDNPLLLNKTAQVYKKYLEFQQFDSLLFMPFVGAKFGSSGSPVFLDYISHPDNWKLEDFFEYTQRPVGMILKTLIGENVTLVLPLQKLAEYAASIDTGKDPFKIKFPEFEISTLVKDGVAYRQLLWFTDADQKRLKASFTETCGMEIKWGSVGRGGWGDGGGNKNLTGFLTQESLNAAEIPKIQDNQNLSCENGGILYQGERGSKKLMALRDPYNPKHIVRLSSIHRLLEFFNRLKKSKVKKFGVKWFYQPMI